MNNQVKLTPVSHDLYELLEDFEWATELDKGIVPKGFATNGANLPLFVRSIWDCYSPSFISPVVVHDHLYELARVTKDIDELYRSYKKADKVFYSLLLKYGRSKITSFVFYAALRFANAVRKLYDILIWRAAWK